MKKALVLALLAVFTFTVFTSCAAKDLELLDFLNAGTDDLDYDGREVLLIGEVDVDSGMFIDSQIVDGTVLYDEVMGRIKEINKKYNVNIVYDCLGLNNTYEQYFTALMSSGICPGDIVYGHSDSKMQIFAESGYLYPLTYLNDYIDYEDSSKFGSAGILECSMVDGVPYAVQPVLWPGFQDNFDYVIVYNPTMVLQQGLPNLHEYYENETWTWETFQPIIENFDKGGDAELYALSTVEDSFAKMAFGSNGVKCVDYIDGVLKTDITAAKAVTALEWMQNILLNNKDTVKITDNWKLDDFINSRVMMSMAATPDLTTGNLQFDSDIHFSIMPFPSGPDATYGEWAQYAAAIRGFAIPSNSDAPELSAMIISDLFEPFDQFGGEAGLADYFNENVFFDPIDTEIYLTVGQNIRYTYWRTETSINTLFSEAGKLYKSSSAMEILQSVEPQLSSFIEETLASNYENYIHELLYAE